MNDNIVQYIINVSGNAQANIERIGGQAEKSAGQVGGFMSAIQKVRDVGLAVNAVVGVFSKISSSVQGLTAAYNMQAVAETKLEAVMRRTMSASREEMDGIKALASAQQALGVIGDEVQLAGAAELATYLSKADSMKKVIPAMNDMLAHQYGLNATQEQSVTIATMVGKVLQGQTGALSKYGYSFTNAQEKILKFGTEEQRVAILADIVAESVGGVNAALANTPEGRLKQHANDMGDLQERAGAVVTQIRLAFLSINESVGGLMNTIVTFFENNIEKIKQIIGVAVKVVSAAFTALGAAVRFVWDVFNGLLTVLPYVATALGLIGVYLVALNAKFLIFAVQFYAYAAWCGIVTAATWLWTAAQTALTVIMNLNPVALIITGIVALIALIAFLAIKIKGWGTLWEGIVGFMKNIFLAYVESIKLAWETVINGIMIGIDKIKLGWYQFKKAVGIGDSSENDAMIDRINGDVEKRKQSIIDGAKKVAEYSKAAVKSFEKVDLSWDKKVTLKDSIGKMMASLLLNDNSSAVNNDLVTNNDLSKDLSQTTTAISSGGKTVKNFNITINDGLIGKVDNHFGSTDESPASAGDFMWRMSEALQLMLNDVNYAGG
jgi:hypothetical protein